MKTVDARGLSCPEPVIRMRNAVLEGELPLVVLVETTTSRENVRRVAEKMDLEVKIENMEHDEFKLTLEKNE